MTENIKKNIPLGLNTKTLGLSGGDNLNIDFAAKLNKLRGSSTSRPGSSIVVVKKNKFSSSKQKPESAEKSFSAPNSLTDAEMLKRVEALQHSSRKAMEDAAAIQNAENDKHVEKDIDVVPPLEESLESEDGIENIDNLLQDDVQPYEKKSTAFPSIRRNDVRNLDKLYAQQPLSESMPPVNIEKRVENKTAAVSSLGTKKKVEQSLENAADTRNSSYLRKQASESRREGKGRFSISDLESNEDSEYRKTRSLSSIRRAREKRYKRQSGAINQTQGQEKIVREVMIPDFISVQELSNRMAEKASKLIKSLMNLGAMVTVNQSIDADTAELLVAEFGHKVKRVTDEEFEKSYIDSTNDDESSLEKRPPVVTIMGHVDHGKTSLLDALRSTDIASKESGGITQHIGAYMVQLSNDEAITFLDTPGHEAFTAMRLRGAKVTDIVVLVVAADDSIKEQTIEAISHAKAAEVAIIVAINKVDKSGANPEAVKHALLSHNLIPEDMGGDIMVVEVSAKNKTGLDKLEEAILLQADLLSLKANYNRAAKGTVIESKIDKGRGITATLLVQSGTLKVGDIVVAGSCYGKIKLLINDKKENLTAASPSTPVEVLGLNQVPTAGDDFIVVEDERVAKELADFRTHRAKEKKIASSRKLSLEHLFTKSKQEGNVLNIIIKGDVHGSVEAINASLMKLPNDEIELKILHSGVGGITESDVSLATASNALIIGFNVRANNPAKDLAKTLNVNIKYYSVIYNLVDEIKDILGGMLSPTIKEKFLGYAEIRQVFDLTKFGKVAGCYVTDGIILRTAHVRLLRDNIVIHEGELKALRRFKDDVKEVRTGFECGISFERYEDMKAGDKIEAFEIIKESRVL